MPRRKVNIKDVAAKAGVHASTVSRVLNADTRSMVSEKVAGRIEKIADQLGYARSPLASGLRTGRSLTIGVMIPDLTNPLFPPIVRSIERTLSARGYVVMLTDSDNDQKNELALLKSMRARQIDGLILATAHRKDQVVDICVMEQIPLVLVNRTTDKHNAASVINDDALGIEMAVQHLVAQGHQRIAYIGGPQNTSTGRDRYLAFRQLMKNGQLKSHADLIVNAKAFTEAEGERVLGSMLKLRQKFTAVVAANDLLALGCYDALQAKGLSCPGDISVTGFNDMPFVDKLSPALTSLRIPHEELGNQAAQLLLAQLADPESGSNTIITLKPELIVRASTAQPK
jgi:LacI family transcriptional regulator